MIYHWSFRVLDTQKLIKHRTPRRNEGFSIFLLGWIYVPTYVLEFFSYVVWCDLFTCVFKILSCVSYFLCLWMFGTDFVDDIIRLLDVIPCGLGLYVDVGRIPLFTIEDWFQVELMSASLSGWILFWCIWVSTPCKLFIFLKC